MVALLETYSGHGEIRVAKSRQRMIRDTRVNAIRQIVQGFVCLLAPQCQAAEPQAPETNDEAEDDRWRALASGLPPSALDWLKEQYRAEQSRQDAINRNLNLPVTTVALLLGLIGYFVPKFVFQLDGTLERVVTVSFSLVSVGVAVCCILAVLFIGRILWGHSYGYVTPPGEIAEDMCEIREYYAEMGEADPDTAIQIDFEHSLMTQYAKHAHCNFWSNTEKATLLLRARKLMVVATMLFALQSCLFYANHFLHKNKGTTVHSPQGEGHNVEEKTK